MLISIYLYEYFLYSYLIKSSKHLQFFSLNLHNLLLIFYIFLNQQLIHFSFLIMLFFYFFTTIHLILCLIFISNFQFLNLFLLNYLLMPDFLMLVLIWIQLILTFFLILHFLSFTKQKYLINPFYWLLIILLIKFHFPHLIQLWFF